MKRIVAFLLCLILVIPLSVCAYAEVQEPKTTKILAIGNSFTENSVSMLRNFSDGDISAQTDLLVASLTIGGISLETHEKNIKENAEKYKYIKRYKTKEEKANVSVQQALTFEEWDYIVVQQVSHLAGLEETYELYLENILKYIKSIVPNAKIVFNQTWAYEIDSKHNQYHRYNNSQSQMFMKIRSAYNKYAAKYSLDIIPCAEAFQLARGEAMFDYKNGGTSLCVEDGYHANTAGCYLLGAVWYEYFTKKSVWDNVYTHKNLTKAQMYTLKRSAHNAIKARYTVSGNNDDTYGFLVETVTSKKPVEYISSALTTTSIAESSQTTTTSAATSTLGQTTTTSVISDEISSEPSDIQTAVPMPKQRPWLVIILVTFIALIAVGGAVVLVVFLATKNKK
ncbi:MAG: DUF4886 domain-containing protein [Clostridia bacterium]|nr:DUF4886 domain-containing protein [Clostridia bacterium]